MADNARLTIGGMLNRHLDQVGTRLNTGLPDSARQSIIDDTRNYLPMLPPAGFNWDKLGGSLTFHPPMYWHPDTVIETDHPGSDLEIFLREAENTNADPTAIPLLDKFVSLWAAANLLKALDRFTDKAQPYLQRLPAVDGHNLANADASLQDEWTLRRAWIRLLHFPGLIFDHQAQFAFLNVYKLGREFLEHEIFHIPAGNNDHYAQSTDDDYYKAVAWMSPCRDGILEALQKAVEVAFQPIETPGNRFGLNQPGRANLSRIEQLRYNMSPDLFTRTLKAILARYKEVIDDQPGSRLIMDLLQRENNFELQLTVEHVEDKLMDKLILPIDEVELLSQRTGDPSQDFSPDNYAGNVRSGIPALYKAFLLKIMKGISLVNRQRRNFRLMRDWARHRPWDTIFQLYDISNPENEWLDREVPLLHDMMRTGPLGPIDARSSYKAIAGSLLEIEPLIFNPNGEIEASVMTCAVCNKVFTGGTADAGRISTLDATIAVLPCLQQHTFHLACAFEYWDQPGRYLFNCPTCGRAPDLMHERIGMAAGEAWALYDTDHDSFVHNVFEYYPSPLLNVRNNPRSKANRSLRDAFYNVPQKADALAPDGTVPALRKNLAKNYWLRENMHTASYYSLVPGVLEDPQAMPLRGSLSRPPGWSHPRYEETTGFIQGLPEHWQGRNVGARLEQDFYDRIVPRFRQRFPENLARNMAQGGIASASRFSVAQEAAVVRHYRRKKNARRRERIKRNGIGLGGRAAAGGVQLRGVGEPPPAPQAPQAE